jgi:uncharacterized protein (DUF433 family)
MNAELGLGIFTASDISNILLLPSNKVRRWIGNYWDNRFINNQNDVYSWGSGKDKAVNFHTFIELYVFIKLRDLGLGYKKIITAHQVISNELNVKYPFASTKILAGENDIFYYFDNETIVKADRTNQIGFKNIIEQYYNRIEFDSDSLAEKYWPLGKSNSIIVDPKHKFGQPTIIGTNILVDTIAGLYKGGESPEFIASIYDITSKQVKDALEYINRAA